MGCPRIKSPAQILGVILIASQILLSQDYWIGSRCGNYSPTLDRIVINSCTSYEPDEYLVFHTNQSSLNIKGNGLSVQVNVTNGTYIANGWGPNPAELDKMNRRSGCNKKPLFLDPFASPYNGVIPAQSNVIAFVQSEPNFSGSLSGLCGQEALFVVFGNFSHYFANSMFGNSCGANTGCTRNIVISLGNCDYDIVYAPDRLANQNGAYIQGRGRSVLYGTSTNCRPDFENFRDTPDPTMNRKELSICENDSIASNKFSALNGNEFTTWYTDLAKSPIAWGPTFHPSSTLFPMPQSGEPTLRSIFVRNEYGGRPGDALQLTLITYPSPVTDSISLWCVPDSSCLYCIGEQVSLGVNINQSPETGGFPYQPFIISDDSTEYSINKLDTGKNIIALPPVSTSAKSYHIISVENKYGCISFSGFTQQHLNIRFKDSITEYLPTISDMCINDTILVLPDSPGGVSGHWFINDSLVKKIDPGFLGPDLYTLVYKPNLKCTTIDSSQFSILDSSTVEILLPEVICQATLYVPKLSKDSDKYGHWSIDPKVPIDSISGAVPISELTAGETYFWTYEIDSYCSGKSKANITMPDCSCTIAAVEFDKSCQDNGTPVDSTDDTFTFGLTLSGQNLSTGWISTDRSIAGVYDSLYPMGPYSISEGTKSWTFIDKNDSNCLTTIIVEPPPACSRRCEISAVVSDKSCQDNGTPVDSTDDTFTFGLTLSGQNLSTGWISTDRSMAGVYDSLYPMGPYSISEGAKYWTFIDNNDSNCLTTIIVEPPPACSRRCEISAVVSDKSCQDNGTPVDSSDDTFTCDLTLSGQNLSTGWISTDRSMAGVYDSLYQIGPYPISEGAKYWTFIDNNDSNCLTTIIVEPPPACSRRCEITAVESDKSCQDNGTPADSSDDIFTFDLTLSGQNLSTGWITTDRSIAGIYDSLYPMGPYSISEGAKSWNFIDKNGSTCRTTIIVEPPPACSRRCEITGVVSGKSCQDNGTPADSSDDTFSFGLTLSGQNLNSGWISTDESIKGVYDSAYQVGPYPVSEGAKSWTLQDINDTSCKATIKVLPPETCSQSCNMDVIIKDSCFLDPRSGASIFYFLDIDIPFQDPQFWVYHNNLLLDIIPGQGIIPVGPFNSSEVGDELLISYDKNPNCTRRIQLHEPKSCVSACHIEIQDLAYSQCHPDKRSELSRFDLSLKALANDYPVEIFVNEEFLGHLSDSNTYTFPVHNTKEELDSIQVIIKYNAACMKAVQIPNPCKGQFSYIPNVFSPNKDGYNDEWVARFPADSELISGEVYDRWGNRIFFWDESKMINGRITWDGSSGGLKAEPGTYVFTIIFKQNGMTESRSGQILLLR